MGIIDSSEHVELPPELTLQLLLFIQFFVRTNCGDFKSEKLCPFDVVDELKNDDLGLSAQGFLVIRGVVVVFVVIFDDNLLSSGVDLKVAALLVNDDDVFEKFKTFVLDIVPVLFFISH